MNRREVLIATAALGVASAAVKTDAQAAHDWPSKPIRAVNPWPAGGPADVLVRPIAEKLSEKLGATCYVDSRPGANGTIGSRAVVDSKPDGYTILFAHMSSIVLSPVTNARMPYDPLSDFTPITQIVSSSTTFVVRSEIPVKTLAEFISYAKARPRDINYGSVGYASTNHLLGELLQVKTGIELTHIPYQGAAPLLVDLLAGRLQASFLPIPAVRAHLEAGTFRALAVTTPQPAAVLPGVPPANLTVPGLELDSWYGVMGPAKLPDELRDRFQQALSEIINSPTISAGLIKDGYEPRGGPSADFAARIKDDVTRWKQLCDQLNIRAY